MDKLKVNKMLLCLATCGVLLVQHNNSYALPFTIVPDFTHPYGTVMAEGTSTQASYIVTNNTTSWRGGNFVKYLPQNVSVLPWGCGQEFDLAPAGHHDSSCILHLAIKGAVIPNQEPANNLFVCFPGGKTCAGTLFPLSVSVIRDTGYNFSAIAARNEDVYVGGLDKYNKGQVWQKIKGLWTEGYEGQPYSPVEAIAPVSDDQVYLGGDDPSVYPFGAGWVLNYNPRSKHVEDTGFTAATNSVGITSLLYNQGTLYVGGTSNPTGGVTPDTPITGQVWKYVNGSWFSTSLPSPAPKYPVTTVEALAFSHHHNTLFAAVMNNGANTISGGNYAQVLAYNNGSWTDTGLPSSADNCTYLVDIDTLAVDAKGNLYAGGQDSNYRGAIWKYDGHNWYPLYAPHHATFISSLVFSKNGVLYAGGFDGHDYSGQIWYDLKGAWVSTELKSSADIYAMAVTSKNVLYAIGNYPNARAAIWSINAL